MGESASGRWVGLVLALLTGCDGGGTSSLESTDQFQVGISDELGDRDSLPGAALYAQHCGECHDGTVAKAPHFSWLEMMSGATLMASLEDGVMRPQADPLSTSERVQVVEYITRQRFDPDRQVPQPPACSDPATAGAVAAPVGWGHDNTRFVPADVAGLTAADVPRLELRWAFGFPDALRARSQPAVGYGNVYVGSHDGTVYALDLATGCARWTFKATAEVRTGIVLTPGDAAQERPLAFFGDLVGKAYAVNARTGELVWTFRTDDHPSATVTATPALSGDTLYVGVSSLEVTPAADPAYECCTFRGKVMAVDAATGTVRWVTHTIPEQPRITGRTSVGTNAWAPSGAPVWASPTIDVDAGVVYLGTGENYSSPADANSDAIVALRLADGERLWSWQATAGDAWNVACMMEDNPNCPEEDGPDFDFGSSFLLIDAADRRLLIAGHKDGSVMAVDPAAPVQGPVWRTQLGRGSIQGGVHFGMAAEGTTVYVPINDMNDTRNGDVLDPELARPGVHAVDASTGGILWQHVQEDRCGGDRSFCDPGVSAALTAIPGVVFAGHLDGVVRAYARSDGALLWEFDTVRPLDTVNGVEARGGSMSGAGPAVADGYLIVNSGYGLYFHEPGNALLVVAAGD